MEKEKLENQKIKEGEMEKVAGGYDAIGMIYLDKEEQDILKLIQEQYSMSDNKKLQ